MTRLDTALAINSQSDLEVNFINANGGKAQAAANVYAESLVSVKCSGLGNPAPTWAWTFTNFYTELTNYAETTESLSG